MKCPVCGAAGAYVSSPSCSAGRPVEYVCYGDGTRHTFLRYPGACAEAERDNAASLQESKSNAAGIPETFEARKKDA